MRGLSRRSHDVLQLGREILLLLLQTENLAVSVLRPREAEKQGLLVEEQTAAAGVKSSLVQVAAIAAHGVF